MSAASAVWAMIDMETVAGVAAVLTIGFLTFFGLRLLHLPSIKSVTHAEHEALVTLGQLEKRTHYVITDKKNEKENGVGDWGRTSKEER